MTELSHAEMHQTDGGAIYIQYEGIAGDVSSCTSTSSASGGGAGKVSYSDISLF